MNQPFLRFGGLPGAVGVAVSVLLTFPSVASAKEEKNNQIVIRADEVPDRGPAAPKVRPGRRRRAPPFTVKVMADPVNVQAPHASLTRLIVGPASRVAMHRHPRSAKILYLMKGRARLLGPPGTKPIKMMPGSAAFLPPGYPHVIENMGRQAEAAFLQAFSPPGPERVYRDPRNKAARVDFEVIRDPSRIKAPPGLKPALATIESASTMKMAGVKGNAKILLEEKTTGSSAMALAVLELDGGVELPRHAHTGASEILYVMSGAGKVTVGGETHAFGPNSAIYIPADQPHGAKVSGSGPTMAVQIYAPAGPEQRFRGALPPAAKDGVQAARQTAAGQTLGAPVGGPVGGKEGR
jgi:quercetin dioxygenase-like cupin family protein